MRVKVRFFLRSFVIASIPLGLAVWIVLPPLFSLVIILSLSYLDEIFVERLDAHAARGKVEIDF